MEDSKELESEMQFLDAMRAYRRARESGDPQAIQEAENAWREQVRREMVEREDCGA